MTLRMTCLTLLILCILSVMKAAAVPLKDESAKKPKDAQALAEIQDFVGKWNLEATQKAMGSTAARKKTVAWDWKFKEGDPWLSIDLADPNAKLRLKQAPQRP